MHKQLLCLPLFALLMLPAQAQEPGTNPLVGAHTLRMPWNAGAADCSASKSNEVIEAHHYSSDTHVIRQNPCVDYEANLIYLLVGKERSLLVDTGAVDGPNAGRTAFVVENMLQTDGADQRPLLVVHTHGHLDHRAGDAEFAKLSGVEIAPIESEPLRKFLGLADWPNGLGQIDLGGRIVDLIPAPGHHPDHIVFYDRNTKLLLTGDFLLPGRLLVDDIDAYRASAQRVADFVKTHPVDYVLGAHIELDVGGEAYPSGSTYHPNERALPLSADDVLALPAALADFNGFYSGHANFIVVNPIRNLLALAAAGLAALTLLVWLGRRLWKRRRAAVA
ncbi:MAG TPA: MBL fold metallo-hydrolase [Steroidobacteraceae bacterium]